MGWVKTERCILSELWKPESGNWCVYKSMLSPKALGETPSCLSQFPVALGILGLVSASFQLLLLPSYVLVPCVSSPLLSSYKDTYHWMRGPPNPGWSRLDTLVTSTETLSLNKVTVTGSRWTHLLEPPFNSRQAPAWGDSSLKMMFDLKMCIFCILLH